MFILEKEMLRLIEEETNKVLQEAISPRQIEMVGDILKGAGKSADEAEEFTDILRMARGIDELGEDELVQALRSFTGDVTGELSDETAKSLARALKKADGDVVSAPNTRRPDTDLDYDARRPDTDVAADMAGETAAARRVINLGDGDLLDQTGDVIRRASDGVELEPEQTRQVLAIVRRSNDAPVAEVADDIVDAIDLPNFNKRRVLAVLAAIGVVGAGGKIALDNFAIPAAGEGDVSVSRPAPGPGGGSPASPPSTTAPAGGETAPGWETYLSGSKYVTPDQAMQVHNAWVEYVKSQEATLQEEISEKASFANFVQWWKENKKDGNLGKYGSWFDTVKALKAQTKAAAAEPAASAPAPAAAAEPAPAAPAPAAPAAAKLAADKGPVTPLSDKYEKNLALLKQAQAEYAADKEERSFIKSGVIKKYPALKGSFAVGKGGMDDDVTKTEILRAIRLTMEKEAQQYKRLRDRELKQMKRKTKRISESVINESVYNRWQTLIKN